ncbi:123_t:CDS:1, partial [Funneliformis caledonium]
TNSKGLVYGARKTFSATFGTRRVFVCHIKYRNEYLVFMWSDPLTYSFTNIKERILILKLSPFVLWSRLVNNEAIGY